MKHQLLTSVTILATLSLSACATHLQAPKKALPTRYVLKNCQTVEEVNVMPVPGQKGHTELTCDCANKIEKVDGRTGRVIVECR